jgi:tetratricopeptide (TPR) repeat protein
MKRSSRVMAGVMGLIAVLLAAGLRAEEPAKKTDTAKPQWQRLLQGGDAKKAAEQEKKLAQLQEAGQFAEALKIAEALTELRAKVQGADHWEAVNARFAVEAVRRVQKAKKEEQQGYSRALVMQREAEAWFAKGRYGEAQSLFEQVLAGFRKVLGEEHPLMAAGYNWLGYSLIAQAKYPEAEENLQKALTLSRKLLGEEHPDTAKIYETVAGNRLEQVQFKKAEEDFRKVLAIKRKVLGEEDAETAASYDNLAQSLDGQGKPQEAEEDFRKALEIRIKVLGEENPVTAQSYNNVAAKLNDQGKYREAETGFRKALAIFRKAGGEEHPDTATCYHNLAGNLQDQGKYKEAEENYRKALVIKRKLLGEEHPDTAKCLDNMAGNLEDQGKYREAEEGRLKALAIRLKVFQEENSETAISYSNVATNQLKQGKYKEAEQGYRKALAIELKVLGQEYAQTAKSYNNLAFSLDLQGKYEEAEANYRKALAIKCKILGEEHPDTATSYDNMAANLLAQRKYKQAEEGVRKALAIRRKVLGEEHADTAKSSGNMAYILNAQGKYKDAEEYGLLAAKIFDKARLHIAASGLERATIATRQSPFPALAAVLARNGKPNDAWQRFEESLARGTWDDLSARLRRPQAERDQQTQITTRIDRLSKLIERADVAKPTPEQTKQREEWLSQLRQAYDELTAFAQQLEKKYGPIAGQVLPRAQIQKSLPCDAAFVAWLDIPGQPKSADPNGEHWAILLRSTGDPVWTRLSGSGDKNAWTDADTKLPGLLREALQSSRGIWQPLAERLRKQRLDPLAPHLKGVRRLIELPSTALAGVPVEVIADGYTVSYAHSGTMFAHLRQQRPLTNKGLFVLADPAFDPPKEKEKLQPLPPGGVLITMVMPGSNAAKSGLKPNDVLLRYGDTDLNKPGDFKPRPESSDADERVSVIVWRDGRTSKRLVRPGKLGVQIAKEPAPQAVAEQRRMDRWLASRSGGDDGNWPRLPGTRIEAISLHRLFDKDTPVQMLLASDASEQRLNELAKSGDLGKYRYIHLATHGEVNDAFPLRSAVILARDRLPDDKQRTELLVSGQPIPDGRLEADEALRRWNLHADLVTLSACQTALGKYERGEGFVGFAQALILCGTRSVCLSLWKVDDVATALLMERFYQNLLGKRADLHAQMPKAAALAEAKAWLRTLSRNEAEKLTMALTEGDSRSKPTSKRPTLETPPATAKEKPSDCPFAHPHFWAAFILTGDPE